MFLNWDQILWMDVLISLVIALGLVVVSMSTTVIEEANWTKQVLACLCECSLVNFFVFVD